MPKPKRAPIDYAPQFGAGIFRPADAVTDDLATLADQDETSDRPEQNDRTIERSNDRLRVRHSFDIWQDQLLALTEIQTRLFLETRRKPKLGELVQAALDAYIAHHRPSSNERTNERTKISHSYD